MVLVGANDNKLIILKTQKERKSSVLIREKGEDTELFRER